MTDWGRAMYVTPGVVVDGELVTTDLVEINLGIRILLGNSYYDDWEGEETFVTKDPLGNPVDQRHPWNQTTIPKPQKRNLENGPYSWVMSPRWFDKRSGKHLALDTGGGPLARLWATALADIVDQRYVKATGNSVMIHLPKTVTLGRGGARVEDPEVGQHHRARPRARLLHRVRRGDGACTSSSRRWRGCAAATCRSSSPSRCPTRRSAAASTRRCAACCRTTS